MPVQNTKSELLNLLGEEAIQAWDQHKKDDIRFGIINLPSGIQGGIAQLVTVKWDKYGMEVQDESLRGKPYVLFRGIALTPQQHKGVKVQGQGVMITNPLCDTPNKKLNGEPGTKGAWVAELMNEFKKLGIDTSNTSIMDIEPIMASLMQRKPFFRFSTRGWTPPKKSPTDPEPTEMVFTQYDGVCEAPTGVVVPNGFADKTMSPPARQLSNTAPSPQPTSIPVEVQYTEPPVEYNDNSDLDSLAVRADNMDQEAIDTLNQNALDKGYTQKQIDAAPSWAGVVDMIRTPAQSTTKVEAPVAKPKPAPKAKAPEPVAPPPPPAEPEWEPKVEEVYGYCPTVRGKKADKPVEVEVIAVDLDNKTVTLKNMESPKTKYPNISWDDLESM